MSTIGDLIREREGRIKAMNRAWHEAKGNPNLQASYQSQQERLSEEIIALHEQLANDEPLHSDMVMLDIGTTDFIVQVLEQMKDQYEKELERTDLYPNIRDWAFKKQRALRDVIWMLSGGKDYYDEPPQPVPAYLVFAEFPDGSVDLFEEDSEADAEEREEALVDEDGAITTKYQAIAEAGSKRLVYRPLTSYDNVYKEMPSHVLERVIRGAGGSANVKLPDDEEPVQRKRVRAGA